MNYNLSNILNILLATALVLLSLKIAYSRNNPENKTSESSSAYQTILSRTSIRQYKDKNVEEEKIEKLLRAGMAAPSAGNKQPWRFVVIRDKNIQQSITENIGPAQPAAKAPLVIAVCADLTATFAADGRDYWIEDCSAATQNILLAAHDMSLGAVWLGVYPQVKRVEFLKKLLSLPENIIPLGMVAIGYADEDPAPKDKWNPDFIHYNSWKKNTAIDLFIKNLSEK